MDAAIGSRAAFGRFDIEAIPDGALVLLVGPAGAGKSTWAGRTFGTHEVLSSDQLRALVAGDPADQSASAEAFGILHALVRARSRRGLRTVVDATNLSRDARRALLRVARQASRPSVAVIFDVSLERCLAWNAARPGRQVPEAVVREQHERLLRAIGTLPTEGFGLLVLVPEEDLLGR